MVLVVGLDGRRGQETDDLLQPAGIDCAHQRRLSAKVAAYIALPRQTLKKCGIGGGWGRRRMGVEFRGRMWKVKEQGVGGGGGEGGWGRRAKRRSYER